MTMSRKMGVDRMVTCVKVRLSRPIVEGGENQGVSAPPPLLCEEEEETEVSVESNPELESVLWFVQ